MSRGSLRLHLALAFVTVAVLGIVVTAVAVGEGVSRHFEDYLGRNQRVRAEKVAIFLTQVYEQGGGSLTLVVREADRLVGMAGMQAWLVDPRGQVIWESGPGHGPRRPWWRVDGGEAPRGSPPGDRVGKGQCVPLVVNGQEVASLYFWPDGGPGPHGEEATFMAGVRRALWLGGGLASLLAVLVGLGVARGLSRPLTDIKQAADRLCEGDLRQQVPEEGSDEVRALAAAFNHLARTLARQEELRRNLTADVAHELRTPLAVLRGHIEAMQDGILEASPANLSALHGEIMRLVRLVGDLEKLNEAEADSLELQVTDVDLGQVASRVVTTFRPAFEQKGITLALHSGTGVPALKGDEDKLSQVIWNLISNALKFTPPGGRVEVTVESRAVRPGSTGEVRVSVTDTGGGIAPKDLPYVFERLYRSRREGTRGEEGAGIGLAIAQALARAHGGRVEARSELGKGSTFTLILPLR